MLKHRVFLTARIVLSGTSLTLATCLAQQPAPSPSQAAPVKQTSAQLIDVFASNAKSGEPEQGLTESDFEVIDEGKPAAITSFVRPGEVGTRPAVFWIVFQCAMPSTYKNGPGAVNNGSGFLRGFTADLASGLLKLSPGEAYGVAHWCDDGTASLDLQPNRRIAQLGPTVTSVLAHPIEPSLNPFLGEDALQKVTREAVGATLRFNPQAMPVLIFFYGDYSSGNVRDVSQLGQQLLTSPAVVFLVNNGLADRPHGAFREVPMIVGHLADLTGGSYFHVPFGSRDPLAYAEALDVVVGRLHSRYQLSWIPRKLDSEEHTLSVRLTASARKAHPGVELRFRNVYMPSLDAVAKK